MMRRLARAELRRHRTESRFLRTSILLASAVMSYFALSTADFFRPVWDTSLPGQDFFRTVQNCLLVIACIALGLAFFMLFGAFSLHYDRQSVMLGALESLGAETRQLCRLLLTEAAMLAALPLPLGLLLGMGFSLLPLPGTAAGGGAELLLLPLLYPVMGTAIAVAALCPLFLRRGKAAVVRLRQTDNPSLTKRRPYRRSRTFRALSVPAQLGRKNVDHYARRYRTVALIFACAASVLLIGVTLYHYLGGVSIVMDNNPYDGVDTIVASASAVLGVLSLTAAVSVLLAAMAVIYAANVIFSLMRDRQSEFAVLQSIGMDARQIREMVVGECSALGLMTVGRCFVLSLLVSTFFSVIFRTEMIYYPFLPVLLVCGVLLLVVRLLGAAACRYLAQINVIESIKL